MDNQNDEPEFRHYRCHLRSAPGMWATYDGHVDVWAPNEEEVFERAVRLLGRTSFPDRRGLGCLAPGARRGAVSRGGPPRALCCQKRYRAYRFVYGARWA